MIIHSRLMRGIKQYLHKSMGLGIEKAQMIVRSRGINQPDELMIEVQGYKQFNGKTKQYDPGPIFIISAIEIKP